jgi:uncharacterized Zn finger protein
MTRETAAAKARRLLSEGALTVTRVVGDVVDAVCTGDSGVWQLGHDPARGWWCACPATPGRCSHVAALRLVTTVTARQGAPAERTA